MERLDGSEVIMINITMNKIANVVDQDSGEITKLKLTDKDVFSYLSSFPDVDHKVESIGFDLAISDNTVRNCLKTLDKAGFMQSRYRIANQLPDGKRFYDRHGEEITLTNINDIK